MIDVMKALSESVPRDDSEYLAEDGLIHCKKCGGAREVVIKLFGEQKKVRCICKCKQDELKAEQEKEKRRLIEINRRECFNGSKYVNSTFDKSDDSDEMSVGRNYVKHFKEFRRDGKGLLLYGNTGTGKSHMAACIANELLNQGYLVKMTNISTKVTELQAASFEDRKNYFYNIRKYDLLIIDDLGTERNTEFMLEQVYNIIDSRYSSGLPMIVTANIPVADMMKPSNIESARIYDRIVERCYPMEIKGTSRRKKQMMNDYERIEKLLRG